MIITSVMARSRPDEEMHELEVKALATAQEVAELARGVANSRKLSFATARKVEMLVGIKNIYYSDKPGKEKVILVFDDGTRITKTMLPGDTFDLNIGVALAYMEKVFGSKNRFHKMVQSKLPKTEQ